MTADPVVRAATTYSVTDYRVRVTRVGADVTADVYVQVPHHGEEYLVTHRGQAAEALVPAPERIEA